MLNKGMSDLYEFEQMLKLDPESKAFAPLAEGYRKSGKLDKALQIALKGVEKHPQFNSGKVSLARILIDLKKYSEAQSALEAVIESDFENILAHRLLGETYILTKEFNKALNSYKAALLIQPNDQKSQHMVSKLESFSFEGFSDGDFFDSALPQEKAAHQIERKQLGTESALAYIDALIKRNNYNAALEYIKSCLTRFPNNIEIKKRQSYLHELKQLGKSSITKEELLAKPQVVDAKVSTLKKALANIEQQLKTRPELYKA